MESNSRPPDASAAAAELAALQTDRRAVADRAVQPWWYDVALGLLVFVFFGSYATHRWELIGAAWVVAGLGCWGLVTYYRRSTGLWVNGFRQGATAKATTVWFWCCVAWGATAACDAFFDLPVLLVAVSAACGVAVALISRWWTRIFVAELRGEL